MLKRLIKAKLFLNIDKCEFFVKEIQVFKFNYHYRKDKNEFSKDRNYCKLKEVSLHQKRTNIFELLQISIENSFITTQT